MAVQSQQVSFAGFTPRACDFFLRLGGNNTKEWFEAHRPEYEALLQRPFRALAEELSSFMLGLDPMLRVAPGKVVSRIHRDTRFSRDKSPYKTNLWLAFKRSSKDWKLHPCFFFEMAADWYRYGMGYYCAPKVTMDALRQELALRPEGFRKVIAPFASDDGVSVEGEQYKKPRAPDVPEDLMTWRQRKSFAVVKNGTPDALLFSSGLADAVKAGFSAMAPLYYFLWDLEAEALPHQPVSGHTAD